MTRAPLLLALAATFALPVCATSQTGVERKKPFAELSASAQRLKRSVSERVGRLSTPVEVHDPAVLEIPEQALRDSVVAIARQQIGTRYVLGGTSPSRGFDCSGLVRFVLAALRLGVPRTADEQAWSGLAVTPDTSALRPGDLVTFGNTSRIHHIGIYTGDGRFIHASVKAGRVIESSITRRTSPLIRKWAGARRLLALRDSIPTS
ncbi:MAG: C40 family peptidase [Gemmatimonadota bacterium]